LNFEVYEMKTDNSLVMPFVPPGAKLTMPTRPIWDPRFKWRDSAKTDVTRTWRKARLLAKLQGGVA
jgi:hypothetical protein